MCIHSNRFVFLLQLFSIPAVFVKASQYSYPFASPTVSYSLPSGGHNRNFLYGASSGGYPSSTTSNRNLVGSAITTGSSGDGSSGRTRNFLSFGNIGNVASNGGTDYSTFLGVGDGTTGKYSGSASIGNILGGGNTEQFLRGGSTENFWDGEGARIFNGGGGQYYLNSNTGQIETVKSAGRGGAGKSVNSSSGKAVTVGESAKSHGTANVENLFVSSNPGKSKGSTSAGGGGGSKSGGSNAARDIFSVGANKPGSGTAGSYGEINQNLRGDRSGNLYGNWNNFGSTDILQSESFNKLIGQSLTNINNFNAAANPWNTDSGGLIVSGAAPSSPPVSAPVPTPVTLPTPVIRKHIYVHVPPADAESTKPAVPVSPPQAPQKHYRIIFIKTPSAAPPTVTPADSRQNLEKTLIYVLFNKAEDYQIRLPSPPAPTEPTKPEVFFIRYKGADDAGEPVAVESTPAGQLEDPQVQEHQLLQSDQNVESLELAHGAVDGTAFPSATRIVHGGDYREACRSGQFSSFCNGGY